MNRFVNLSKKHGHPEYGVFREKLKGRSLATSMSLAAALEVLARNRVIESANATMVKMTKDAEPYRYSGKAAPVSGPMMK